MKQFLAEQYSQIEMNALGQAGEYTGNKQQLINLSIGDHDLITHEEVIKQALEDTLKGYTKYTHPLGMEEVRAAISELGHKQCGKKVENDQIMMTVGACHGMTLALKALINSGDEVIVIAPYFPVYQQQIEDVAGCMKVVYTQEANGFVPAIEDIKKLLTDKTKAIIINSPCNPSGAILSREFLQELYLLSQQAGFVILADEVYTAFTFNGHQFVSMLEIDPELTHTVILKSLSKDYAMTGWRIGYIIAQTDFVGITRHINESITYSAPAVSQRAALAAIKNHDQITKELQQIYEDRVNACYKAIQNIPQLGVAEPKGSIYLFVNVQGTGMTGADFADQLLKEQGVLVLPGDIFGSVYTDYVRIACNKDKEVLVEAFERIRELFV